jgi:hypothetical protein
VDKKLNNLTDEQVELFPEYRKKWIARGLNTEPCDIDKAKEEICKAYKTAGLKPPKKWYHFRSPLECAIGMATIEYGENPTKSQINEHISAQVYGNHDAGWLSFYDYLKDLGVKGCEQLTPVIDLAKYCGWWAPYEDCCAIQDHPLVINFDDQNLLHSEAGPAIEYGDGFSVYAWHGTRVPKQWIEDPDNSLTAETALYWENAEERRAACEIIGWDKIISMLNAKVIDENENPEIGTLLEVNHDNIGSKEKFLRVQCGTGRTFAIPVPPDMSTALEANAWTYNITANDYEIEVRT